MLDKWLQGAGAPHLAIVGRSGAGKTSLAKRLMLYLLANEKNVTVLDFDGEYLDTPIPIITPPFLIPPGVSLAWLLSQAARPSGEEGMGGFGLAGLTSLLIEDSQDVQDVNAKIKELISALRRDYTLPSTIRFGLLWRLMVFRKYFIVQDSELPRNFVADVSSVLDVRERQVTQQILASLIVHSHPTQSSDPLFLFVEEGVPGDWIRDLVIMSRRRGVRIVYISQSLPPSSVQSSFETIIFTPFLSPQRLPLSLPVDPAQDRGVWWTGVLGTRRLSLNI